MLKKLILSLLTFSVFFVLFTMYFFPYEAVFKFYMNTSINNNNIPVSYSSVEASSFGAKVSNISYFYQRQYELGTLNINYSPLSLITKSVSVRTINSPLNVNAEFKDNAVTFNIKQKTSDITDLAPQAADYIKTGNLDINGKVNPFTMQGSTTIEANNLTLSTPVMDVEFDSIYSKLNLDKNRLSVAEFRTGGNNKINLSGTVYLNYKKIIYSNLNLKGNIDVSGFKRNFSLRGRLANPKLNL